MKKRIIPIFVPHRGCPHDCIFCNQKKITGVSTEVTSEEARNIIRGIRDTKKTITDLDNKGLNVKELETSFYTNVDKAISNLPIMLHKAVDNLSNNKRLVK